MCWGADGGCPGAPVEPGRRLGEGVHGRRVVGELGVAVADDVPVVAGELCLERDDARGAVGRRLGTADLRELEHPGDVGDVGLPDLGVLVVAVVGLVRQPEPCLVEVHDVLLRVLGVVVDPEPERARPAGSLESAERAGELSLRGRAGDESEV